MSSFSVPKKLLKGGKKRGGEVLAYASSYHSNPIIQITDLTSHRPKTIEPPPLPYPPPSLFVPLTPSSIENQIGLLQHYYTSRLASPRGLEDDEPEAGKAKMGPLGQILRPRITLVGGKKKNSGKKKAKEGKEDDNEG